MAYSPNNLSALSFANGFTLWHYRTTDTAATVDTSGYFNAAASMLRPGDFILTNANTGGTVENGLLVVVNNAPGAVDVANMTSFGTVNID